MAAPFSNKACVDEARPSCRLPGLTSHGATTGCCGRCARRPLRGVNLNARSWPMAAASRTPRQLTFKSCGAGRRKQGRARASGWDGFMRAARCRAVGMLRLLRRAPTVQPSGATASPCCRRARVRCCRSRSRPDCRRGPRPNSPGARARRPSATRALPQGRITGAAQVGHQLHTSVVVWVRA